MIEDIIKKVNEEHGKKPDDGSKSTEKQEDKASEVKAEEAKTEEVKSTETKEEIKEPIKEEKKEEVFSFETGLTHFNKELGTEFENLDSLRSFITSSKENNTKLTTLEEDVKRKADLEEQVRLLEERIDPLANFATKEDYVVNQLKREMPDASSSILEKIIKSDPKDFNELDAIAIDMALHSGVSIDEAKKYIAKEAGVDLEEDNWSSVDEWNDTQKTYLKIKSSGAYRNMYDLQGKIQMPEKISAEELLAAKKAQEQENITRRVDTWSKIGSELTNYDGITHDVKDKEGNVIKTFSYKSSDEFNKGFSEAYTKAMIDKGVDPSLVQPEEILEERRRAFLSMNLNKILNTYREDILSEQKAKEINEYHNDKPLNDNKTPDTVRESNIAKAEEFASRMGGNKKFR
jgi:hypothetical protein